MLFCGVGCAQLVPVLSLGAALPCHVVLCCVVLLCTVLRMVCSAVLG